ncbi:MULTISPECIES: hypothetical protein [unclassified Nocardiopsis]|uniref:hypothetical protein n=1 Tax=Nocardiopsis TaxID=2013 RepID=UPI00387AFD71
MSKPAFPRRAEMPYEHRGRVIHAVRFSGRTLDHPDGAMHTACGRVETLSQFHPPKYHGDDAPVTCPACVTALSSEEA